MLFLVTCVYDEGVEATRFRVVEAASRLAVAQAIVESPDIWSKFLHDAHLYDPIVRGDMPYYADPKPVTAEEALRLIDRSSVDGDSRARMSIHPITEILTLPASSPTPHTLHPAFRKEGISMAYSTFTLSQMAQQFHLQIDEKSELFRPVPEVALRPAFQEQLNELAPLALAVASEKARSELIIAPVLIEAWRMTGQQIGFFSGVNFDVDKSQGLDGFCDYILTRTPRQLFIEAPVLLMMVEAKNEDLKKGYAQCMAEMIAAQRFNVQESSPTEKMYGVVTIGEKWKFMELEGMTVRIDSHDYYLDHIGKIMGILLHLTGRL